MSRRFFLYLGGGKRLRPKTFPKPRIIDLAERSIPNAFCATAFGESSLIAGIRLAVDRRRPIARLELGERVRSGRRGLGGNRRIECRGLGRLDVGDIGVELIAQSRNGGHEAGGKGHGEHGGTRLRPISFAQSGLGVLRAFGDRAIDHGATSWDVVRFLLHFPK